jgi:hypothetical protein
MRPPSTSDFGPLLVRRAASKNLGWKFVPVGERLGGLTRFNLLKREYRFERSRDGDTFMTGRRLKASRRGLESGWHRDLF